MNTLLLSLIIKAGPQIPAIVAEVEKAMKDVENPQAGQDKAKQMIQDAIELLQLVIKAV